MVYCGVWWHFKQLNASMHMMGIELSKKRRYQMKYYIGISINLRVQVLVLVKRYNTYLRKIFPASSCKFLIVLQTQVRVSPDPVSAAEEKEEVGAPTLHVSDLNNGTECKERTWLAKHF